MDINQPAKAVLAKLERSNGHITYDEVLLTVTFYDGDTGGGFGGEPEDMEVFTYLRDHKLIERTGPPSHTRGPGQKRYKITEAGRATLK